MPSGENQFYVDKPSRGENYGAYVADELVEFTRKMFPLSHKKKIRLSQDYQWVATGR